MSKSGTFPVKVVAINPRLLRSAATRYSPVYPTSLVCLPAAITPAAVGRDTEICDISRGQIFPSRLIQNEPSPTSRISDLV
jgi:hypothetical protein